MFRSRRHPRRAVVWLLALAPFVVLLAGAGFAVLEQDTVSSYWEGLWWALSLMTTVGFVGESPETTGGRILSGFLMVSGFAVLTIATAALASLFVREEELPTEEREFAFERQALERLNDIAARIEVIEAQLERAPERGDGG